MVGETLEGEIENLAAIGRALTTDGELRLWSCDTGAGAEGTAFTRALAEATGTDVAAATGRIGAAALGGSWDLPARAGACVHPPLTEAGVAGYAGVLANKTWTGPGGTTSSPKSGNWNSSSNWSGGTPGGSDTAILGGGTTAYTISLDTSTTIQGLTISGTNAILSFNSTRNLTLTNGANALSNAGTINLNGQSLSDTNNSAAFSNTGTITLTGGTLSASGTSGSISNTGTDQRLRHGDGRDLRRRGCRGIRRHAGHYQ